MDKEGRVVNPCWDSYLITSEGKVEQIRALGLKGKVVVIGDGWTDSLPRQRGVADEFLAFTENKRREEVVEVADGEVRNMEEMIEKLVISN